MLAGQRPFAVQCEGQLWPVVPMAGQRPLGHRCEIVFAALPAQCPAVRIQQCWSLSQNPETPGENTAQGRPRPHPSGVTDCSANSVGMNGCHFGQNCYSSVKINFKL